jgi:toxin ParE1/3/4
MTNYELSAAAEIDLDAIYTYTFDQFGLRQAELYLTGLAGAFRRLADMPEIRRTANDIRPSLLQYRYQSHMIFYTASEDGVVIRRVLHARMNFGTRL